MLKPVHPCRRCGKLIREPLCEDCQRAEWNLRDGNRVEDHRFYNSARWKILRASHLATEPLCRMCGEEKRTTAAAVVDHIIPRRVRPDLELSDENLQSLCENCHNQKKQASDRAAFG